LIDRIESVYIYYLPEGGFGTVGDLKKIIDETIKSIQEQQSYKVIELNDNLKIIHDLGFSSLDIAQLVATLEMETGFDPFSKGVSIKEINTLGDIYKIYQNEAGN
jgi:acyl carrier protein